MEDMREKNSILNAISNLIIMILQIVLAFVVRFVFVKVLNEQYLGIQGLFTNIISVLSIAELGLSTAICFSLYEPLANRDKERTSILVSLFRKLYLYIGLIIIIVGILLIPFLKYIATGYEMGNLNIIFIMYLISSALGYFLTYPEILISADQKRYKLSNIYIISVIVTNVLQIIMLLITKNFLLYILCDCIIKLIQYILINKFVKKSYKEIDFYNKKKLEKKDKDVLKNNVKSLFLYKIGDYLINGTDNIIISKIINISCVGIYSNYLSVISIFKNILISIISGITASFGNLIIKEKEEIQENVFNIMNFITYLFCGLIFICLIFLFNRFVLLCYGEKYLLNITEVIIICINFYLGTMLSTIETVKSAAGLYYQDRYVSIIQAIINVIISIALGFKLGLIGILIGTLISYILTTVWERPVIVYKKIFKSSCIKYFKKYLIQIAIIGVNIIIDYLIINKFFEEITILNFIFIGIIIFTIFSITNIVIFRKSKEFKYCYNLVISKLRIKRGSI